MPSDMSAFFAFGGEAESSVGHEYSVGRTEPLGALHHASPEDLMRKFVIISKELQVLSGKKMQQVEEAKKQFEKESEERARRDSEEEARRGSDGSSKRKDSSRFATHSGADEEDLEAKRLQARPSMLRAATAGVGTTDAGAAEEAGAERKASQNAGGLGGEPAISTSALSDMEERFLQACDPRGLCPKIISLVGEDTESALLMGYQRILAYFRHKSMLADLGDHFDRMRHAAMMGEDGAIHELAQANAGESSPTPKAQQNAGQAGKSKSPGKKKVSAARPSVQRASLANQAMHQNHALNKGHVRLPDSHPPGPPGDQSGDDGAQRAKKWGKAKLPALTKRPDSNAPEVSAARPSVQGPSLANQAMHQNHALNKAGLGHIVRRSQLQHAEGVPVGVRKSLSRQRTRSKMSLVDQSPYQSEGVVEPLPPPTAPGPAGPRKSRGMAVSHQRSEPGPAGRRKSSAMAVSRQRTDGTR